MALKKLKVRFKFLEKSKYFSFVSFLLCMFSVFFIWKKGFVYGVDFAGGIEMYLSFSEKVSEDEIKKAISYKSSVQSFKNKNEYLLRVEAVKAEDEAKSSKIQNEYIQRIIHSLEQRFKDKKVQVLKVDSVGSQIGDEMKQNSLLAMIYCLLIILVYIGLRFDYIYSPPAVICLFHDSLITLGVFSFLGKEVNVQTLAAILTIIGYSLNDTIVTFDRIRENIPIYKGSDFFDVINLSLNDVLSRSLLTSITTLIAVLAMYFIAGGVIRDFAFTLMIGVFIGTYSSIYIASPLVLLLQKVKEQKAQKL